MNAESRQITSFVSILAFCILSVPCAQLACADQVEVTITGEVEFNQIISGFLGDVSPGDMATLTFFLDSDSFVDSTNFPTRGYEIDTSSFVLGFNGSSIGLQNPFPGTETPFFVLRNDDPAVDGFFLGSNIDGFPNGNPIDQVGVFGNFRNNFSVTYSGDTLSSLDILDALGTYDFTNLSVFNWTIDDGGFQPLGIVFTDMTISSGAVPEPSVLMPLICTGVLMLCRRKKR